MGATLLAAVEKEVVRSGGRWDSLEQQSLSLADSLLPIKYDRKNDLVTVLAIFLNTKNLRKAKALLARQENANSRLSGCFPKKSP